MLDIIVLVLMICAGCAGNADLVQLMMCTDELA